MGFEAYAAASLEAASAEVAQRWLANVASTEASSSELPEHPGLVVAAADVVRQIARFVGDDDVESYRTDPAVAETITSFRQIRDGGHSEASFLLHELESLARTLDDACSDWLASYPGGDPPADAVLRVAGRLNRAPILLGEISLHANGEDSGNGGMTLKTRQFADMLSHELNTPLNAAVVTAQLLEYTDGALRSPEARRLVTLIRRNLARADAVMRDVRTAALSPSERVEGRTRPFGQVLGETLTEVHDELVSEQVRLEVEEPVADVVVDAARVKLVLVNLIRNAIRYSDPHRPTRWVRVSCCRSAAQDQWWVHVSDNGLGIPTEHQDSIFQRYFRAHPQRGSGTGLGLMIAREEIEQIGGRIEFSSEAGIGTTFRFSLPPAQPIIDGYSPPDV